MTKEEVLKELKAAREGYVPGSATYTAYNNAIELVESLECRV